MKTVIYHSADFDGIFCREIARKFLGDEGVKYIGWNFGDQPIFVNIPPLGDVYFLDLPVDQPMGFNWKKPETVVERFGDVQAMKEFNNRLMWIDHHTTSITSHPRDIPGYRIDGVAACRLVWQWFVGAKESWQKGDGHVPPNPNRGFYVLPEKQAFIDRKVDEPLAVRLVGEYDVWTRDEDGNLLPGLWEFQCGLRATEAMNGLDWKRLLRNGSEYVQALQYKGEIAAAYGNYLNTEMMAEAGFIFEWEGLRFLAVNNAGRGSQRFASRNKPETGHDALLSFGYTGRGWVVSLYHAQHRTDIDLSKIATKHGGGGHKGAAGFTCKTLPFSLDH